MAGGALAPFEEGLLKYVWGEVPDELVVRSSGSMSLQRTISLERDWSLVKDLCDTVEGRHPLTLIPWILYSPPTTERCLALVSSG